MKYQLIGTVVLINKGLNEKLSLNYSNGIIQRVCEYPENSRSTLMVVISDRTPADEGWVLSKKHHTLELIDFHGRASDKDEYYRVEASEIGGIALIPKSFKEKYVEDYNNGKRISNVGIGWTLLHKGMFYHSDYRRNCIRNSFTGEIAELNDFDINKVKVAVKDSGHASFFKCDVVNKDNFHIKTKARFKLTNIVPNGNPDFISYEVIKIKKVNLDKIEQDGKTIIAHFKNGQTNTYKKSKILQETDTEIILSNLNKPVSQYWYTKEGVHRYSKYWNQVKECIWYLDAPQHDFKKVRLFENKVVGFCPWDEFEHI